MKTRILARLAVWSAALLFASTPRESAGACAVPPADLAGWWPGDGTANDLATTNHGSLQNGATYAAGKVGWAFSFDGVDDYVQIGAPTSLVMTVSLSVEAWIYPTGPGSGANNIGGIIVNKEGEYEFARFSDGTLAVALANASPGWTWMSGPATAPLSQWTHVAFTYDGNEVKFYTNGTLVFSTNATGTIGDHHPGTNDFRIGGRQGVSQFFQGLIDELAIYRRALAGTEIQAISAAGADGKCRPGQCLPAPAGLIGWWTGDATANDYAGTNHGILQNGTAFASGKVGQSFSFDGVNDSVDLGNWFNLQTFSLALWVYPSASQMTYADIIDNNHTDSRGWVIQYQNTGLLFAYGAANIGAIQFNLAADTWQHLAVTVDSNRVHRVYTNGVLAGSVASANPITYDGTQFLRLGKWGGGGRHFRGQLDEVSVFNRALTSAEVEAIHYAGAAGMCKTAAIAGAVPYFTDFESGIGLEWSSAITDNTHPNPFTRFTGRFGNSAQTLTVTNLTPGSRYTLSFDFYAIDSWDGSPTPNGPDYFNISIQGTQVFHHTFGGNQTYPSPPDLVGMFGFYGWNDSIYRNLEARFTALSNSAPIAFSGQGLQALTDESWGIDNVSVRPSAEDPPAYIQASTLPSHLSTNVLAIDKFTLTASRDLLFNSATNAANYRLREAGPNGLLGDGDDVLLALTPAFTAGRQVVLTPVESPLQPGHYQFDTLTTLLDVNSNSVTVFLREFTLINPPAGTVENTANDGPNVATLLPMTETPAGSGFWTAYGIGTFSSTSDVDYWRFSAEAGDRVTVRVEIENSGTVNYLYLYLQNSANTTLAGANTSAAAYTIQNYAITAPGTYYLKVYHTGWAGRYRLRIDQSRGPQLETEANDSQGAANQLALAIAANSFQGRVAGALPAEDSAGDYFRLRTLNVGNTISATLALPDGASLATNEVVLTVEAAGNSTALDTNTTGALNYTVIGDAVHFLRVQSTNRGIRAQYLLNVVINDGAPPLITSVTLPAEGTITNDLVDTFTMGFSEDLVATTVTASASYELRHANGDYYLVTGDGYTSGLTANFTIADGPLQPGSYTFTVRTNLQDPAGNNLAAPYVRTFTIAGVNGFVAETRSNDSLWRATSLSHSPMNAAPDGTFVAAGSVAVGTNPQFILAGHFNADTNLDLVTANLVSDNLHVLLGNGDGTFQAASVPGAGDGPIALAAGHFNNDTNLDLAVANHYGGNLSVLLGNGDGTFGSATNYATGNNPYGIASADFNHDGFGDLVTANSGSGNISVRLATGTGGFGAISNYATGSGPYGVATGDLNGDGHADLAVANMNADNVSVLLGRGDGTFFAPTNYAVGDGPRFVAIGDMGQDGQPDLVVISYIDNVVSVLRGNGDGTFQPRIAYAAGSNNPYQLALSDLDLDGWLDVVVPSYGGNQVCLLYNQGDGTLKPAYLHTQSGNPISAAVGDYNQDGRPDLALALYSANSVTVLLGSRTEPLAESPADSGVRSGAGRGSLSGAADLDYWSFYGAAGDLLTVAVENPGNPAASRLLYRVYRPNGTEWFNFYSGTAGWGQGGPQTLPVTGRYVVRVERNNDYFGEYRLRVTTVRPPIQMESEDNSNTGAADGVVWTLTNHHFRAAMNGYIGTGDPNGDYFALGNQADQTTISLLVDYPSNSPLAAILGLYNSAGTLVTNSVLGSTNLIYMVPAGGYGAYYARITAGGGTSGLLSQYLLDFDLADTTPPIITGDTLPAEGAVINSLFDRFDLSFSEDMMSAHVNDASRYDFRAAGPDDEWDTADDEVYAVASTGYSTGRSASYLISDGPLHPGRYRFLAKTNLADKADNGLQTNYMRTFTVVGVAGFMAENRNNDTPANATPLSTQLGPQADGSVQMAGNYGVGNNPFDIGTGDFNGDGHLDVVTPNNSSGNVSLLLGNGDGTFRPATNFLTGSGPISVVTGDFNQDGKWDVAVANHTAHTVSLLLGNGDGSLRPATNYAVGNNPRPIAAGDFNGDGFLDLATANQSHNNVSVLLGDGSGAFAPRVNYAVGSTPYGLAVGDFNGDGKLDLATANAGAANASVLLGNGDGTFGTAVSYAAGTTPRSVAAADLNGDGKQDLALIAATDNQVNVLLGNGDGTFQARNTYAAGTSDPYRLTLTDLNQDGRLDVVVAGYGNNRLCVLLNRGDGALETASAYVTSGNPMAAVGGDFNHDGQPDLVTAHYTGHYVTFWPGNPALILGEDSSTGLRIGAGRGKLSSTADVDYWSFSARAGDRLMVAVDTLGNPTTSSLNYRVDEPDGSQALAAFNADARGWGQSAPVTLSVSGTYTLRVAVNQGYLGEYRVRITLAPPPVQLETEANNSIAQANTPALTLTNAHQLATVLGSVSIADSNGDYYRLGNQAYGSTIRLALQQPQSSGFDGRLFLYNGAGALVTNGLTNLIYLVPLGGDSTYYAQVYPYPVGHAPTFGNALQLNGAADYASVPDSAKLDFGTNDFTAEAWVFVSSIRLLANAEYAVVNKSATYQNSAGWGMEISTYDGAYPNFVAKLYNTGGPVWGQGNATSGVLEANRWHHLAGIRSNGVLYLLVNGVLAGVNTNSQAALNVDNNQPLLIGDHSWGNALPGMISEARLWNRALTPAEIQANLHQALAGNEAGLVACWRLNASSGSVVADSSTNGLNGTLLGSPTWVGTAANSYQHYGLMAQYLLDIDIGDATPPLITGDTLPTEGSTNTSVLDRFNLSFSEDMQPASVVADGTYDLRAAGADGLFDTADDEIYLVSCTGYSSGLSASYRMPDGPLQPGLYRLLVKTNLSDKAGNGLAAAYERRFAIAALEGYQLENRNNGGAATATSLSFAPGAGAAGSHRLLTNATVGVNPHFIAAGHLNGDPHLDLVTANANSANVSVLLGNGDGSFRAATNFAVGSAPKVVAIGDVNGDANADLVAANYNAHTVSVLLGNGAGAFQLVSNYTVGANPWSVELADFNHDGLLDLATANYVGDNVSVLLGIGGGAFQPAVNYPARDSSMTIAVTDFNQDGHPDLVTANANDDSLSLFQGAGDGTFAAAGTLPSGRLPRFVRAGDLNGDGRADLAAFNAGDNTFSVWIAKAEGGFETRQVYAVGTSDAYQLHLADLNGDNHPDVVIPSYGNSRLFVLINKGNGTFGNAANYAGTANPISVVAGDFNGDGRLDLATANYQGQAVSIYLGYGAEILPPDPLGEGIRTAAGRGNLLNNADYDYWSFEGNAGDWLAIAAEIPGNPGGSQLNYRVDRPDGGILVEFSSTANGWGQSSPVQLPVSGRYTLYVRYNNDYQGEYRFRVTLVPASATPLRQLESEDNNNTSQADPLSYAIGGGHQTASLHAYAGTGDTSGDYYRLGQLLAGTTVTLNLRRPPAGGVAAFMSILNPSGTAVAASAVDESQLVYTIPAGGEGVYYARVLANNLVPALTFNGTPGSALLFNGGNDYVEASDAGLPAGAAPRTLEFWMRPNYNARMPVIYGNYASLNAFFVVVINDKACIGRWGGGDVAGTTPVTDGRWHHAALVYDGAGSVKLYIDGVLEATANWNFNTTLRGQIYLGGAIGGSGDRYVGLLDEVRLWNTARTQQEILDHLTNHLTGAEAGLAAYWRCDEGTGRLLSDSRGQGRNGSLYGAATWVSSSLGNAQPPGLMAQYILDVDLANTTPPQIASVNLPAENSTNSYLVDRFTISFNAELDGALTNLNKIQAYGGHNYLLTDSAVTWLEAERQAIALGGHLVTINDAAENEWVRATFASAQNIWLGLNDENQEGAFGWVSGDPLPYTNWLAGQPDNSANEDYVEMQVGGGWNDLPIHMTRRGLIELSGPDSDGDGLIDQVDPYPADPLNGVDLRATGPDGLFDSADDIVYRPYSFSYSGGLSLSGWFTGYPLQPGSYRFQITGGWRDLYGNAMTPFTRYFTVTDVPGYRLENRTNSPAANATPLDMVEDPPGLKSGFGRGFLSGTWDDDFWSFSGTAGEWVVVAVEVPGNPAGSSLGYRVYHPNGALLTEFAGSYYGYGQSTPVVLPSNGVYTVRVYANGYDFQGEYRLRVTAVTGSTQIETEGNDTIGAALPLTLATNGDARTATVAGYLRLSGDLDYYHLGAVTNGATIFLSVRQPGSSAIQPVVSVYNAAGTVFAEAGAGRPNDGVAEVRITESGTYYALVRSLDTTAGLPQQYLLDAQVVPTGLLNFPNLQVTAMTLPDGSIYSGQSVALSYTIKNVGYVATDASSWQDRVVMSVNNVFGDADDIPLGIFARNGALAADQEYTVSPAVTLPDGIQGNYYLIVQADSGNAVNEFLFEGDNALVSTQTFAVTRANYPDLKVENLSVSGPDANDVYTVIWNTANRGLLAAPGGFHERLFVRNQTTGAVLVNQEDATTNSLGVNEILPRTNTLTATVPGTYQVLVTTDARNAVYEYDAISHASAEENTAAASFVITQYFNVVLAASPTNAGFVAGAGRFAAGSQVAVSAEADTNALPWYFQSWTEAGQVQSLTNPYIFSLSRDRTLTANFALPAFQITASNNPPAGGQVAGAGTYAYGTTNVLTAQAGYGYRFTNWTENGEVVGTNLTLTTVVYSNRLVVANYAEAHLLHEISTATQPSGLAVVEGAGVYTNGQVANLAAPPRITNEPTLYFFQRFTLNGTNYSTNASLAKTLATTDSTNLAFVAVYGSRSLRPLVAEVTLNHSQPAPATTNLVLTIRFDRSMQTAFEPLIALTNADNVLQPEIPSGGVWLTTSVSNDTYRTPPITLAQGMDGTNRLWVAEAQDLEGNSLAPTNVLALRIDATPPLLAGIAVTPGAVSATINWATDEPATRQVNYGLTDSYGQTSSLAGSLLTNHQVTISGLTPNTLYHARARSRDQAGNETVSADFTFATTPAPDLQTVDLRVLPSGDLLAGGLVTVQWRTTNTGGGAAGGAWYDLLVVSNLTTGQRLLETPLYYNAASSGNIAPGDFRDRQHAFSLPNGPAGAGSLAFLVAADYYNNLLEQNEEATAELNNSAALNRAALLPLYPDLEVSSVTLDPASPQSGLSVNLHWTLTNAGAAAVTNSFYDRVIVRHLGSGEILLDTVRYYNGSDTNLGAIAAGEERERQFTLHLPDGARGTGDLQVEITADFYNGVFEYRTGANAEANNGRTNQFTSTLAAYPDLVITNIIAPADALPGQFATAVWTLVNQGNAAAAGPWTEQVFLSGDNAIGGDQLLGAFTVAGPLAAGASLQVTQQLALPAFALGSHWLVARTDAGNTVFELDENNNTFLAGQPINLAAGLSLSFNRAQAPENAGSNAVLGTVTRNADASGSLEVALSASDTNNLVLPTTVMIPAGQASANFYLATLDDGLVNGTRPVSITAAAAGLSSATNVLTITDNDIPTLSLQLSAASVLESAGAAAVIGYLTRNSSTNSDLVVALTSGDPGRVTVPATVNIAAGSSAVAFDINLVDNNVPNVALRVSIIPTAAGFHSVPATLEVLDDDVPALTLAVADPVVSEGDANPATEGIVTRNPVSPLATTILLQSSDNRVATVPIRVTIPANEASATFPISVVNNNLVDGARAYTIGAFVGDGLTQQPVPQSGVWSTNQVTDDDGPTLVVTVLAGMVSETGAAVGNVWRNTPATNELVVNLSSSDPGEATVEPSVIIPSGQSSVNFTINGVEDHQPDGVQRVTIAADAPGYNSGRASINVSDIDLPDLRVSDVGSPAFGLSGSQVQVNWTVANTGLSEASGVWIERLYLSSYSSGANPQYLSQQVVAGPLPVGASTNRFANINLPANPGVYYLVVTADAANSIVEGNERNNTLVAVTPITVGPAYRAEAHTDVVAAPAGSVVPISGRAFSSTNNAVPVPYASVSIRLKVKGARRVIMVTTDAGGNFSHQFQPLPNEGGHYTLGADHPGVTEDPEQDAFDIHAMRFRDSDVSLRLFPLIPVSGDTVLHNLGELPLTGLTTELEGLPPFLSLQLDFTNAIPAATNIPVHYTLSPGAVTEAIDIRARAKVTSAEGAVAYLPFYLRLAPHTPALTATPAYLSGGMVRGEQKLVEFEVANVGGASTLGMQVQIPSLGWMSLVSASNIPALGPGETTKVILALNPPADMALTRYDGNVFLNGGTVGISVPFSFRALSDRQGDLAVTVTDDFTYHTPGAPKVTNATVTLTDGLTGALIATAATGSNGVALLTNLLENTYQMTVTAPQHSTYRAPVTVRPGVTNAEEVFIDRQTVSYRWTVVPTQIQDHYRIVLESVFEAEVPVPVVTVDNPLLIPLLPRDEDTQIDIRISNHGLIAAEQVHLEYPTYPYEDPFYEIRPLISVIDVLPAKSSMTLPVIIRPRATAPFIQACLNSTNGLPVWTGCPTQPRLTVKWSYINGKERRWHGVPVETMPVPIETALKDQIKEFFKDQISAITMRGGNWKDLLEWDTKLSELAALIGACPDGYSQYLASQLSLIAGVSASNPQTVIAGALRFSAYRCPSTSGGGGGGGGGGGPVGGAVGGGWGWAGGGGGGRVVGGVANPVIVPIHWDYSPNCNPTVHDNGVCARVRIKIEQEAVITRAAFLGTLELENNRSDLGLSGIRLTLDIRDENQNSANDKFAIRGPDLSGLTAVDGSGTIGASSIGTAKYTFVPTRQAAPDAPTIYRIGGTLEYYEGANRVEVPLLPATITVYPDPVLNLLYFQQRDVYADDPFTDVLEPSEPFALGLMVKNVGKGACLDFTITSAQPKIIENARGLLVDFKIIGTQVGTQAVKPSLTANMGEIEPGKAKVAAWWMTSTLQGKFVDYSATFEHLDGLGDKQMSLIDSVEIHELIHAVRADRPGDDTMPDFLVNDDPDAGALPDTLYLSDGAVMPVQLAANAAADHPVAVDRLSVQLTASMPSGWCYLQIADPGVGYRLDRVERSDGKVLRLEDNVWRTDRTFPSSLAGAIREHRLHLLDYDSTGIYTLHYRVIDPTAPEILDVVDVDPPTQAGPVSSVDVVFSEPIDLATFDAADLVLTRNGGANLAGGGVVVSLVSNATYRIGGLAALTGADGNYELTVLGAGIRDYGDNAVINTGAVRWAKGTVAPVVASLTTVAPNPRNMPVGFLEVTFSKALNPATFDYQDLSLVKDGATELINNSVAIVPLAPATFRITGLGSLTADDGRYVLTVNAAGVQDTNGAAGVGSLAAAWVMDTGGPQPVSLEQVANSPRNIVVQSLDVTFNEPIDAGTFDYRDLTLTRDGGANLINSNVVVSRITDTLYRISNFSWVSGYDGSYVLTVSGLGIADPAGNAGSGSVSASWEMNTAKPAAPTGLAVSPGRAIPGSFSFVPTRSILLQGQIATPGLTVRVFDGVSGVDYGTANVVGTSFSLPITFESAGGHTLLVHTVDGAANTSAEVIYHVYVDLTGPGANFAPVTPNPRQSVLDSLLVTFNEQIWPDSIGVDDFALTLDLTNQVPLAGAAVQYVSGNTWRLTGLAGATAVPGSYRLNLNLAGIEDVAGNFGTGVVSAPWALVSPPTNLAPVAAELRASMMRGRTLELGIAKLLASCQDPDGDPLTVLSVSSPSTNGGLVALGANTITYTPPPNFTGDDVFAYTISDGRGGSAEGRVRIEVQTGDWPGPNIISAQPGPGGFALVFAGVPGREYSIERALVVIGPWTNIANVIVNTNGVTAFLDTNAPPGGAFYRTYSPNSP